MFKRIDHIEIVPHDLQRSIDFYAGILGFKIKERKKVDAPPLEEVVYLDLNGTVIELLSVKDPAPMSQEQWQIGYRMMALEVADMTSAVQYLKGKGIDTTWGPASLGQSQRAEIQDPDGLRIELRQW
ncbi:Glyoxalase/bleomycin resistance protein/dioxygenase [Syntrophobacter sp. SbD1]|nr:Glyoxalase/bleomycin resistance protein/dioxygenase [Syntrophobacter sp. SbD1]